MKKKLLCAAIGLLVVLAIGIGASRLSGHFQSIIPTTDFVAADGAKKISLRLLFNHPMEGGLMNMVRPKRFGVSIKGGDIVDLNSSLKEKKDGKFSTWTAEYEIKRPGDYIFFVEPEPYWEPAEDCFIIHYTKVCVNGMGDEDGWDHELGLKTEIVPLTRPYGLWAGNIFSGIVKLDGKPVPYAEIEVEYYNEPGKSRAHAPTDAHITQVIKADGNGVFHYAMPRTGWWAFAALNTADYKLKTPQGEEKDVELGAVYWVKTYDTFVTK